MGKTLDRQQARRVCRHLSRRESRSPGRAGWLSHLAPEFVFAVLQGRAKLCGLCPGGRLFEDRALQQLRRTAVRPGRRHMASTIFRDVPADELQSFFNQVLGYGDEHRHAELPTSGLSADYVARETHRAWRRRGQVSHLPGDRYRHSHRRRPEKDHARGRLRRHRRGPESRGRRGDLLAKILGNAVGEPGGRRKGGQRFWKVTAPSHRRRGRGEVGRTTGWL